MQLVKFCRVLLALAIVHDLGHQSQLLAHSFGLVDQSLVGLNPDLVCIDVDGRYSSEGARVPVKTCYCPGCPATTSLGRPADWRLLSPQALIRLQTTSAIPVIFMTLLWVSRQIVRSCLPPFS